MVRQWLTSRAAQPASPSAAQRDDIWLHVIAMIQGQITRFINIKTRKTVLAMPLLPAQIVIRLHLRF
ncbi:MAG: hypothetical protein F6K00_00630 [Leptolyngbya sp. SIOISBB]|nr:hypothetical protein [Leptolyngbya sp. SIOISBB]